ncbi:MAG: phosphonopyruvate decarboxylase [Nitrospirae bacterium]|nr:phosphonopyruvate decarboxylase [Candidatus Troglogloeales bacterium]
MIQPEKLFGALKKNGVAFFTGVPDSLLRHFCAFVDDHCGIRDHIITANEGNAVALAVGYHIATGKVAAVYMQNSGLGNTINPLTSLADREVYRIPLLMIVGWRGEPGGKDEPQHVKQGRITPAQMDLLEVPYEVLSSDSDVEQVLEQVFQKLNDTQAPVTLLVRKGTFSEYKSQRQVQTLATLMRKDVLRHLLKLTEPKDLLISTTGKTSRELFELRVERQESQRDFLTVGGMGHAASIALGVALWNSSRRVICLDGDGSVLMHMGALPIIGSIQPKNLVHVVLNNAAHESVGGQPTVADRLDFEAIARASGYSAYFQAHDQAGVEHCWKQLKAQPGPVFFEIKIKKGSSADLGRPTSTPEQNKQAFMQYVRG